MTDEPLECVWAACPVCAQPEAHTYVSFPELDFVECCACRAVYKSRERAELRPTDFYEAKYFHGRKSGRDRRFEHRVNKAQRQLTAALEYIDANSVLDVGCSFGYVLEAGERLRLRATGCDISEYAVQTCRERGYRAEVGTLEDLPFADGEFDVIVLKHVLEHTPSPRAALAEIARVSSKHGAVVIALPDLDYWKGRWLRRSYRYFRPDDLGRQHYVYYTLATLCHLLETCGYRVIARSKAAFRHEHAKHGLLAAIAEGLRFAALQVWQRAAQTLRMRRELFVIAQRKS